MNQNIEIAERLKMHQFQGIVRLALFKIFRQTEMLQIFLVAIEEIVLRETGRKLEERRRSPRIQLVSAAEVHP